MRLVNTHHVTVASLHYAKIPGDVALKGRGCAHTILYKAACMVAHQGATMNILDWDSPSTVGHLNMHI